MASGSTGIPIGRDDPVCPALAIAAARALEQEPGAPFALVDEVLEEARGRDVSVAIAGGVDGAHAVDEVAIVVAQLGEHVLRRDEVRVVVEDALKAGDMADRTQRRSAELSHALCERVRHGQDLVALLVEHQVEITEMRAGQVPVKVLCLQVEGEGVGEERIHSAHDVSGGVGAEVRRGRDRRAKSVGDGHRFQSFEVLMLGGAEIGTRGRCRFEAARIGRPVGVAASQNRMRPGCEKASRPSSRVMVNRVILWAFASRRPARSERRWRREPGLPRRAYRACAGRIRPRYSAPPRLHPRRRGIG